MLSPSTFVLNTLTVKQSAFFHVWTDWIHSQTVNAEYVTAAILEFQSSETAALFISFSFLCFIN